MVNAMDKQTFTNHVLSAGDSFYRVAKSILINESDCEDAVQETILRAWEKRDTLREEQYFKTWMTRILINTCYRIAKKRPETVPLELCTDLRAPDGEPVDTALRVAILQLPQKYRVTVVLYYLEGYSVPEVGRLTKVPAGTVKSRLNKARKLLRETLSQQEESL